MKISCSYDTCQKKKNKNSPISLLLHPEGTSFCYTTAMTILFQTKAISQLQSENYFNQDTFSLLEFKYVAYSCIFLIKLKQQYETHYYIYLLRSYTITKTTSYIPFSVVFKEQAFYSIAFKNFASLTSISPFYLCPNLIMRN